MENNKKDNNMIIQGLKKRTAVIGFALLLFLCGIVIFSDITKPHTFQGGDVISSAEMNENFDRLYAKVNELENIVNPGGGAIVPVGTIFPFAGNTDKIPDGWLLCDGSSYSLYDYSALYGVIGNNFGYPDAGNFYVPDLRGMFLRGVDNGKGTDPDAGARVALKSGGNTGDNVGSMQQDAFQGHWHDIVGGSSEAVDNKMNTSDSSNSKIPWAGTYSSDGHGIPRVSDETRPQNVYVNFIIKH